jgi:hypothetical protein
MGKHKYIETPERMWELFMSYRDEIKDNPIQIVEQKKGNISIPKSYEGDVSELFNAVVHLPCQRPLTMEGFLNYLDDNDIISDATDYFENKEGRYSDYVRICSRIRRVIKQDQIEGGMAGIYNPSITQRLNNLTEKTDITTGGDKIKQVFKIGNQEIEF